MTNAFPTHPAPTFRTHSRALAALRALCVIVLCAALTAGFLAQVWRAPRGATALETHAAAAAGAARAS